uniref:Uncharacterized protein n=1 Tax=Anguilla anguilla TaxID=7936 RepID=A0A0E9S499_ANGAN
MTKKHVAVILFSNIYVYSFMFIDCSLWCRFLALYNVWFLIKRPESPCPLQGNTFIAGSLEDA